MWHKDSRDNSSRPLGFRKREDPAPALDERWARPADGDRLVSGRGESDAAGRGAVEDGSSSGFSASRRGEFRHVADDRGNKVGCDARGQMVQRLRCCHTLILGPIVAGSFSSAER